MIINNLQFNRDSPHKAAFDGFRKISICANALFSVIKEEGFAWKNFLSNNSYVYKIYSVGSNLTDSIARKFFTPSSRHTSPMIDDSNPSMEALHSSNKAWIQERSLLRKSCPKLHFSDEILLDILFNEGTNSKGVIQFAKNFCTHTGHDGLTRVLLDWEKAYERQQFLQNRPQEIRKISGELAEQIEKLGEEQGRLLLRLEKEPTYSNSPLHNYTKKLLEKFKTIHDRLYQTCYRSIKEKFQTYLDTNWKKRCFTEIQEEIRAILLEQYSELHQTGTLKHNLPTPLQPLFVSEGELFLSEETKALAEVIWDLFFQNSLNEEVIQLISVEKLNEIFEKEFTLISRKLHMLALSGINQLMENVGEETQLLLQLYKSRLPQKSQGWLEITPQCDRYCQVNLCVRGTTNPRINMMGYGEAIAIKKYSYNKVRKDLLQTRFFVDLLANIEGDESPISSEAKIKEFFSELGQPVLSCVESDHSNPLHTGMVDEIKSYYCNREESHTGSTEKIFFQMRLHAFVNYCTSVQKYPVLSDAILSTLQNSIEFLQAEARRLHEMKEIADDEYIETIATTLEVEEYTINHQRKIQAEQEESLGKVIPSIIKEQLHNLFLAIPISELDIENIKSFANVLLSKDMSEEIALLCQELPIANKKVYNYTPPHTSLLQLVKTLRIDLGNLRASPIALFKLYCDVNQLVRKSQIVITCLNAILYLSLALYTKPIILFAVVITTAVTFGTILPNDIWNVYKTICNFHQEAYNFLLVRILLRLLQFSDIALHWRQRDLIQEIRSFIRENISNKISFSLSTPLEPISRRTLEELAPENIPREIAPLQRFYPYMRIIPDRHNLHEIRQIVFPKLSMGFRIEAHNGTMRARLHDQSEFCLAEIITDTKLENADFSHLVLENDRGDKKICIVPRSLERLLLQTLLRMFKAYSRKSIDLLSNSLKDSLLKAQPHEPQPTVYYCDWVDGEIVAQDCNAVSYLLTHYMSSGDVIRSQRLVEQLKKMKARGEIENPNAMLTTLEQIVYLVPRSISSDINKIILELSALCQEIPLESIAFPLFLSAYQAYVASKEEDHISYLSEEEESSLLHHLKDEVQQNHLHPVFKGTLTLYKAYSQTFFLFLDQIIHRVSNESLFGKAVYIPTSLKKYTLQREYLSQDGSVIPLMFELYRNNLLNPYFILSKGIINSIVSLFKPYQDQKEVFMDLGLTLRDHPLQILIHLASSIIAMDANKVMEAIKVLPKESKKVMEAKELLKAMDAMGSMGAKEQVIKILEQNRKEDKEVFQDFDELEELLSTTAKELLSTTAKELPSILRNILALFITTNDAFWLEQKLSPLTQFIFDVPFGGFTTRFIEAGAKTVENFVETQNAYKRQEEIENSHWFPVESLWNEYVNLQNLEKSILKRYRDISDTFLEKQDRAFDEAAELNFQEQNSIEGQLRHILNWYEIGGARESNEASYFLNATQSRGDLIQELKQVHTELIAMSERQRQTIQGLLTRPQQQELFLLNHQVERYGEKIRNDSIMAEELQQQIREDYESQSTIKKVERGFLQYINSLVEVPTFGLVQFSESPQIDILRKERSHLMKEVESIEIQKKQLFQNMMTVFKPRTSLGFNEVYTYFCQGKDTSIIKSMDLTDNQWKVFKEQLYRYMILQKYLSYAEHIKQLYISRDRTIDENVDLIGHEIDQMSLSIEKLPARDISVRSLLLLEKKLGRTLSPVLRSRVSDMIGSSMKNYHAVYQLALSP